MVAKGTEAPDFTLPDQDGNPVTLSELRGQPIVLYFYPKADTPGCTTQACGIRDHRADYERTGARVIGVSPDTVAAQKKFAEKYDLDFTLLADEDHSVAELYGVWGDKKMYGFDATSHHRWGVRRSTLPHRSRGRGRPRDPEGLPEDARRGRVGAPRSLAEAA